MYTIALDVEAVLAELHGLFLTEYNNRHGTAFRQSDITSWNWVRDKVDYDEFISITDDIWTTHRENVPATEQGLSETVAKLTDHPLTTVDIVTGRTGVEDAMQEWLAYHNITGHRTFISTNKSKATFDYDIYIDDNPLLADDLSDDQFQYLITRQNPWANTALYHQRTIPTKTVRQAVSHLTNTLTE